MRIRTRLFMMFLVIVGLGFYKLVNWIIDDLRPRYLETMEASMNDTATILASIVEQQAENTRINVNNMSAALDSARRKTFAAKIYHVTKTQINMRVYVTDRHGIVLFDSDGGKDEGRDYSRWNDVARTLKGTYGARTTQVDPDDPKSSVLYVAAPVKINGDIAGVLTVCKPAESVTYFIYSAKKKLILAGVLAAFIVVILSMVTSAWITLPIQRLTDYANAVRDGKRTSLSRLGNSEIGELGSAFEQMRDALEGKLYVENYVGTLTHEMKSPLSAIRGAAELLKEDMPVERRNQFLENIRGESGRLQDLVDRMLQLSAVEKRKALHDVERIDVASLLDDITAGMKPILSAARITVDVACTRPASIRGERFLVRQSICNLVQNAVDFSPKPGIVSIAVEQNDKRVQIVIADKGPGIPDYAIDKVFDRFFSLIRPDTGKKSSGLGLTFVREVAILHGGSIELVNRPDGGARATLTLPLNPPGSAA